MNIDRLVDCDFSKAHGKHQTFKGKFTEGTVEGMMNPTLQGLPGASPSPRHAWTENVG